MSSYTRQQLEDWLKELGPIQGNILDIGGSQLPVVKRLNKDMIYIEEYKILDLEQPHECKEKPDLICDLNIRTEFGNVTVRNYQCIKKEEFEKYDVVFCLEVSEYWWNPIQALKTINNFLKKEGDLFISFHFAYPTHNPTDQDYIRYTKKGILKMLEETGFQLEEFTPRTSKEPGALTNWWNLEGMRPAKEFQSHHEVGGLIRAKKL